MNIPRLNRVLLSGELFDIEFLTGHSLYVHFNVLEAGGVFPCGGGTDVANYMRSHSGAGDIVIVEGRLVPSIGPLGPRVSVERLYPVMLRKEVARLREAELPPTSPPLVGPTEPLVPVGVGAVGTKPASTPVQLDLFKESEERDV